MKFKPTHKPGAVVVELGPQERELPAEMAQTAPDVLSVFRLRKILVPIDFSDCSKKALAYAIPFAQQFGAALTLLHVVEPYPPVPQMEPIDVNSVEDATEKLKAVQADLDRTLRAQLLVRLGNAHSEIVGAARELGIDLIVLSTQGRTGLAHVLLGSTAEKVVRHAGCPVLVVREQERDFVPPLGGDPAKVT